MVKNQSYKKKIRAEKAKIKLKVGEKTKFLPKGKNVTDVSFKIKPIVLVQQLKGHSDGEILSKRHLNVKELLTRLTHHNKSAKEESCVELRTIIEKYPLEILSDLSVILKQVSVLVSDKEKSTRIQALKTIDAILEKASSINIEPFFTILSSYLKCAMTNIDRNIQEDSLFFVDSLLKHVPNLLAKNADNLLPNFFSLISTIKADSKPGRTLTMNLNSKLTSVTWRNKVLNRLHGILEAICKENNIKTSQSICDNNHTVKSTINCFPLFVNHFESTKYISSDLSAGNNNLDVITKYIETLLSLLFDAWSEVMPEINNTNLQAENTILPIESVSILSCVLKILFLLWNIINDNNSLEQLGQFSSKDSQKFFNNTLTLFPFYQNAAVKKKQKTANSIFELNEDPKCLQENLLICYLFAVMNRKVMETRKIDSANKIINYLSECLTQRGIIKQYHLKYLKLTLGAILLENGTLWLKGGIDLHSFLAKVIQFQNSNGNSLNLFEILSKVTENDSLNRIPTFQIYLSTLPNLLTKPEISEETIDMLLSISKRNIPVFQQGLLQELPNVLNNLTVLKITGNTTNIIKPQLKILYMFYYIPKMFEKHLEVLGKFGTNLNVDKDVYLPFLNGVLLPKFSTKE